MFLWMLRVKSHWHKQLTRDHSDSLLLINKERESLKMLNPEPAINLWFNDKVWRLAACQKCSDTKFVDIAELAMSDLEDESDTIFKGFS